MREDSLVIGADWWFRDFRQAMERIGSGNLVPSRPTAKFVTLPNLSGRAGENFRFHLDQKESSLHGSRSQCRIPVTLNICLMRSHLKDFTRCCLECLFFKFSLPTPQSMREGLR